MKTQNQTIIINRNNCKNKTPIAEETKKHLRYLDELEPIKIKQKSPIIKSHITERYHILNYEAFLEKPSLKILRIELAHPFLSKYKHKTKFGYAYSINAIPCHLQHHAVKLTLHWNKSFDDIDYKEILPICFEGIRETAHPYKFAARQACKEMLLAKGAEEKLEGILLVIFTHLRNALVEENEEMFYDSCDIGEILVKLLKEKSDPYYSLILQAVNKRMFDPKYKKRVHKLLKVIELNCGENALKAIRNKIPSYVGQAKKTR